VELVDALRTRGWTVAVAESLTGGLLTDTLAKMPDAGTWLKGGVVAYSEEVKRRLLGIGDAPVVSEAAARAMADQVAEVLNADVAIAVTGVGGPDPQDGVAAGTVWIATAVKGRLAATLHEFSGDPPTVVAQTCAAAVDALQSALGA
jgi:nicotinamide-nucleotide amidase